MNRRSFNKMLAGLGLGLAAGPMMLPSALAAEEQANYFTWSGYEIPEFHQSYLKKYGESPTSSFFGGSSEGLQKIQGGFKTDIAHPCSDDITKWHAAGVIEPIDTTRLKHWKDYLEPLKNLKSTMTPAGEHLFIPWEWGTSSILYRTDLVDLQGEEDSWNLLFDERYKGKLATYNSAYAGVQLTARVLGFKNLDSLSDEQLAEIKVLLIKQRNVLRFYWDDQSVAGQAMAAGEIVATYAWNDLIKPMEDQGIPVKYMNPKEGTRNWVCGFSLLKPEHRVASDERVYDFLDAMMSPETGAHLIDAYSLGASNSKSYGMVSPERVAEVGLSDPLAFLARGILQPIPPEYDKKYVDLWEEVRLGL